MKNNSLWYITLLAFSGMSFFTSCADEEVAQETQNTPTPSAIDPYPYPEEYIANKDLSVDPGDSFFDYCNGTWLKNNPIPADPTKNLGGLYAANDAMIERVEQLKKSVPDIGKFYTMMDHIHDYPTESHNYIAAQEAKIEKPASKEEAYRTMGKMYLNGLNVLGMGVSLIWDKDKLKLVILPDGETKSDELTIQRLQAEERHSLAETRAGGSTSIPALLAEGMGVDPALLKMTDSEMEKWTTFWNEHTLDQLYAMMQFSWQEYEAYADEEGLKEYNKTLPEEMQITMNDLRNGARFELGYTISYHMQQKFVPQSLKDKFLGLTIDN